VIQNTGNDIQYRVSVVLFFVLHAGDLVICLPSLSLLLFVVPRHLYDSTTTAAQPSCLIPFTVSCGASIPFDYLCGIAVTRSPGPWAVVYSSRLLNAHAWMRHSDLLCTVSIILHGG